MYTHPLALCLSEAIYRSVAMHKTREIKVDLLVCLSDLREMDVSPVSSEAFGAGWAKI